MSVLKKDVPQWIRKSEFWKNNAHDFGDYDELPFPIYIESQNVTNGKEFLDLVKFCQMIDVEYPYSIYIYIHYNFYTLNNYINAEDEDKELHNNLMNRAENSHLKFLRENPDLFSGDKNLPVLIDYVKHSTFPEDIKFDYLQKVVKVYEKVKGKFIYETFPYHSIHGSIKDSELIGELEDKFNILTTKYENNEYIDLLRDIYHNRTLIDKIEDIIEYCYSNPTYYKTKEFHEEYYKSLGVTFKLKPSRNMGATPVESIYGWIRNNSNMINKFFSLYVLVNGNEMCIVDLNDKILDEYEADITGTYEVGAKQLFYTTSGVIHFNFELNIFNLKQAYESIKSANKYYKDLKNGLYS